MCKRVRKFAGKIKAIKLNCIFRECNFLFKSVWTAAASCFELKTSTPFFFSQEYTISVHDYIDLQRDIFYASQAVRRMMIFVNVVVRTSDAKWGNFYSATTIKRARFNTGIKCNQHKHANNKNYSSI